MLYVVFLFLNLWHYNLIFPASSSVFFWLSYGEAKGPPITRRNHPPFWCCSPQNQLLSRPLLINRYTINAITKAL